MHLHYFLFFLIRIDILLSLEYAKTPTISMWCVHYVDTYVRVLGDADEGILVTVTCYLPKLACFLG